MLVALASNVEEQSLPCGRNLMLDGGSSAVQHFDSLFERRA
jgi:hypothetical protein